jgi:cytochrome c-type biogenesis protein
MKNKNGLKISLSLLLITAVIVAGYFIFRYFVVDVTKAFDSYSLLFLAIVAGIATFFSPCSFPTLPAYLSSFYGKEEKNISKIVYYGALTAIGIVVFNIIFGSLIGVLGESFAKSFAISTNQPNLYVRIFRGVVGSALILFGISQYFTGLRFFHNITHYGTRLVTQNSQTTKAFTYGFAYNIIGIGCVGPILSGLILFAFSTGGFVSALSAFIIFSLTMAFLMVVLSFLVGTAKKETVERLTNMAPKIKKLSGVILVLVGLFLLLSSIFIREFVSLLFPS